MLTYNSVVHVNYLFKDNFDAFGHAKETLAEGKLIRAKSSFVALITENPVPGWSFKDWGETGTDKGAKYYYSFSPKRALFVVNKPTWCECPKHYETFAKTPGWAEQHLGYASLIFLCDETLFEAWGAIRRDRGIGRSLLKYISEEELLKHPELVFIPLTEPAKVELAK